MWVFNRVTGEPLWPIEERPVPKSDMPGEKTWPTQPFPTKPPPFRASEIHRRRSESLSQPAGSRSFPRRDSQRAQRRPVHAAGQRGTIQMPGNNGGANWGGAAVDPDNGRLYVVSKDLPAMLKLERDRPTLRADLSTRYTSGFGFMIASDGLSPIGPPWSSLTAYDLNDGTIQWKIPFGEVPELAAKGFKDTGSHYPKVGPGRDRRRRDLHRYAGPQGARARRGHRKGAVGERGRRRARRAFRRSTKWTGASTSCFVPRRR